MNIKRIIACIMLLTMMCSVCAYAKTLEFTVGEENYYVNDAGISQRALDAPAYIENGRTMVPLRAIGESFDAEIGWNPDSREATITTADTVIVLTIGSSEAIVNGQSVALDTAPIISNGRTMVPLRFISETLKKYVEYVPGASQVVISDEEPVMTIDGYPITLDDYRFMFLYYNLADRRYSAEVIVPLLTNSFKENVSIANEAKNQGYALHHTQGTELANSILANEDIYYSLSLTAPGVKTLSDMMCAMNYFNQRFSYEFAYERVLAEYTDKYVCAKHILIPTINQETGEELTSQQQRSAKASADAVYKAAAKGDDFDELIEKYNEDPGVAYNPDGYVFTTGEMVPEFEKTAFELKEGEISKPIKTSYGYHIIKRCPLPELSYDFETVLRQRMLQSDMNIYVGDLLEKSDIKVNMTNAEIVEKLNISDTDIDMLIEEIIASSQQQ